MPSAALAREGYGGKRDPEREIMIFVPCEGTHDPAPGYLNILDVTMKDKRKKYRKKSNVQLAVFRKIYF